MYQLFVIGAIMGYFFPSLTFIFSILLLYINYKFTNTKFEEYQAMVWSRVSDVKYLAKVIAFFSSSNGQPNQSSSITTNQLNTNNFNNFAMYEEIPTVPSTANSGGL
jgi:hypothetical protein